MSKSSSDNSDNSSLEEDSNKLAQRIDNLSEEI